MPLSLSKAGIVYSIKQINGKDDTRRALQNLGFVCGENITVVSEIAGNLIVSVKDARVAISKSMATRIMV